MTYLKLPKSMQAKSIICTRIQNVYHLYFSLIFTSSQHFVTILSAKIVSILTNLLKYVTCIYYSDVSVAYIQNILQNTLLLIKLHFVWITCIYIYIYITCAVYIYIVYYIWDLGIPNNYSKIK